MSCSSTNKIKMERTISNYHVVEMKEYHYAFMFKVLDKENDTILIISLKENYYDKYGYKKPTFNHFQEIKMNETYDFYLTRRNPNVSTMEQLGAFIIVENDTLWRSPTYRDIPPTFMSHNTIGKLYSDQPAREKNKLFN